MLKRDKQNLVKRVTDLETSMDQQVNKIKVHYLQFYITIIILSYKYNMYIIRNGVINDHND
jgi:hypothetical protein